MTEPSGLVRIKDSTKIRLINLQRRSESIDDTIHRMLNVLEIKKPVIKKVSFT